MNCPNCNEQMNKVDDGGPDLLLCEACQICNDDKYWWLSGSWPIHFFHNFEEFKRWIKLRSFQ